MTDSGGPWRRWEVTWATLLLLSVAGLWLFVTFSKNVTGFFRIGDVLPHSPYIEEASTFVYAKQVGYDGQMFLSLALDPALNHPGTLRSLDNPRYRYRRILYPLLAYALSLGHRAVVPYMLVAINILSAVLLVWAVSGLFRRMGTGAGWALLVLAVPGLWVILSLTTSDLLATLFFILAARARELNQVKRTALFLALACLTRETTILLVGAFMVAAVSLRQWRHALHLAWSVVPAGLWNLYAMYRLRDAPPVGPATDWFGFPGAGIVDKIAATMAREMTAAAAFEALSFALLILFFVTVVIEWPELWRNHRHLFLCSCVYLLLFLLSRLKLLGYYVDFYRVFVDLQMIALLSFGVRRRIVKRLTLAGAAACSAAFVAAYAMGYI